jgi:hypothetical protein
MNKKDNRVVSLYSWKYYLIVGVVFLLGIILMLYSENQRPESRWIRFVGEIGAFVAAAIVSHFIYDRLLRKDEESLLIEKLAQLQYEKESGIISSHDKLPVADFIEDIKAAKRRLWFLNTWIDNYNSLEEAVREAVRKNVPVDILILHPQSTYAAARGRELGLEKHDDYARLQIQSNLSNLYKLSTEFSHPKSIRIKLYDSPSVLALYGADDIAYMGFFWRRKNSHQGPHLKLKTHGEGYYFGHNAKMHFEAIWSNAPLLDFTDPEWRNKL